MGDFVELIVFLAVVLVAMLAGGKKRGKQQQQRRPLSGRPPARPVRRATPAVPDREWREPEERSAPPTPVVPTESAGEPTRQSVAREILELLGAQLEEQPAPPAPPTPPPRDAVALDDYRREAVSLERPPREPQALDSVELSRQREHDEFHDRYVDVQAEPQPRRPRSRYHRLTPRTAREAVIWKTIISPPKALE